MSLRFFSILLGLLWLSLPGFAVQNEQSPSYISEWNRKEAKMHIDELQKKFGKLANSEVASAIKRAEEAKKNQDYALEIAERERVVGKTPNDLNVVFALCLARAHRIKNEDLWAERNNLEVEAVHAFLIAKSPEERGRALLFLVASLPTYQAQRATKILADISAIMPLSQLREKFPELADVFPFEYTGFHFDEETATPSVCLSFNQPIAENIQGKDFIQVTPALDGAVILKGNEVCIRGLAHGKTYAFLVKNGLKSQFGEVLAKESTVEVYVPDNEARITFPNDGYVLRKGEQNLLPISTVNITKLAVEIHRLSDRAIASLSSKLLRKGTSYSYYYGNDNQQNVYSGTYEVIPAQEEKKHRNETVVTNIDLNAVLTDIKPGIYDITASPVEGGLQTNVRQARQWLLVTDMGITTYKGAHGLDVDVRSLDNAEPLADVEVQLISQGNEILSAQTTDKQGFVHFPTALLQGKNGNQPVMIFANNSKRQDFSLLYLTDPAFD
ncbi:MAG: hypothetical protein WCG04_06395, partial [Alphaproteobacteria bacterium]